MTGRELISQLAPGNSSPSTKEASPTTGDLNQPVSGVMTALVPTLPMLQKAITAGCNLVIAQEPIFYFEQTLAGSEAFKRKAQFIADHKLMICPLNVITQVPRLARTAAGIQRAMGWAEPRFIPDGPALFTINPTPLRQLAGQFKSTTAGKCVSILGNPDQPCRTVAICVGDTFMQMMRGIPQKLADVFIAGQITEWATGAMIDDAIGTNRPTGLIMAGHHNLENPGLKLMTESIRQQLPNVKVDFFAGEDPFVSA